MEVCQGVFFRWNHPQEILLGGEEIFGEDGIVWRESYGRRKLFYKGEHFHRGVSRKVREFFMERNQIYRHYLKNDQKCNQKNMFFQQKIRRNIKTQNVHTLYCI